MLKRLNEIGEHTALLPAKRATTLQLRRALLTAARMVWDRKGTLLAAVAAACFIVFVAIPAVLGPRISVTPVVRADLIKTVVASGHIEAPYRVSVASQVVGVVAKVAVAEGESVKAGQPLIYLDDREARAVVAQAEGAVAQAEARMRQMRELTLPSAREALAQSQATLTNAQKSFDRAATLAKSGYGTWATLDDTTRALDVARAAVRSAEAQVFTSQPGGSDSVMAEMLLNQTRSALASAESKLSYTVISAPRDGILISRQVESGNVVQPGVSLMKLSPYGDIDIVAQIDEKNLAWLAIGQRALASADAYPQLSFPAEVVFINPGIDLQSATVEVKLRVPDPPPYLRQDMTASVDIEVARRAQTLVAKATDIHDLGSAEPWVFDASSGYAVRRRVRTGLIDSGHVEILEGLNEKSQLISTSATGVLEGRRIRPLPQSERPAS